jgi:hypothetical protein
MEITIDSNDQSHSMNSVEEIVILPVVDTSVPSTVTVPHSPKVIQASSEQQISQLKDPFQYKGSSFGMKTSETVTRILPEICLSIYNYK